MTDFLGIQKTLDEHGTRLERIEKIIVGDVGEDGKTRPGMVPRLERIEGILDESKGILADGLKQLVKLAGRGLWAIFTASAIAIYHLFFH
jgi:hypothetical protein